MQFQIKVCPCDHELQLKYNPNTHKSQHSPTKLRNKSETNGIAERAVRRVKEGTSAVLLQTGLDENWWADSMECFSFLRNVQDLLSDGKTPFERRFWKTI